MNAGSMNSRRSSGGASRKRTNRSASVRAARFAAWSAQKPMTSKPRPQWTRRWPPDQSTTCSKKPGVPRSPVEERAQSQQQRKAGETRREGAGSGMKFPPVLLAPREDLDLLPPRRAAAEGPSFGDRKPVPDDFPVGPEKADQQHQRGQAKARAHQRRQTSGTTATALQARSGRGGGGVGASRRAAIRADKLSLQALIMMPAIAKPQTTGNRSARPMGRPSSETIRAYQSSGRRRASASDCGLRPSDFPAHPP